MDKASFIPAVRRITVIAAALVVSVMMPCTVLAGNINGSEAGLISQASGTFTYEGKTYVATESSLAQLRGYLSQDGIDLTEDQAARAASMMYANVKNGVIEGYIVPVGGDTASGSADGDTDSENNDKEKKENGVTREKAGKATVEVKDKESVFTVTAKDGKTVLKGQLPVKNTGFDLSPALLMAAVLMLMVPAGIVISLKMKLFAHSRDES